MKYYHVRDRANNLWESVDGDLCDKTEVDDNLAERDETILAMDKHITDLSATVKRTDDLILTLTDDNEKQAKKIAALERQEVAGFRVTLEMMLSEEIRKELAIDDTSNGQVAFVRMAEQISDLTATLFERDKDREDLREALQQIHARALLKNQTKILSIADNALNESDALKEKP